jgi:integrase
MTTTNNTITIALTDARPLRKQKNTAPLSDLARLYLAHGPASASACLAALGLILRRTHHTDAWPALSVNVLSATTARRWFDLAQQNARATADQARAQQILRTARSTYAQARAVVCPRSLDHLERAGLRLPGAADFYAAGRTLAPRVAADPAAELPTDATIARTLAEWRVWPADPARANDFAAVGLMLACGLRKAEVAQAKWDWIGARQGVPVLTARAAVKNQTGRLEVVPLEPFWCDFLAGATRPTDPGAYILGGSWSERTDAVFRRVGAWLRGLGWATQKTNHALRDYSASLIAMKYGLHFAKIWCRHSSIKTTERSYNHFVDPITMIQRAHTLDWLSFAGENKLKKAIDNQNGAR